MYKVWAGKVLRTDHRYVLALESWDGRVEQVEEHNAWNTPVSRMMLHGDI